MKCVGSNLLSAEDSAQYHFKEETEEEKALKERKKLCIHLYRIQTFISQSLAGPVLPKLQRYKNRVKQPP